MNQHLTWEQISDCLAGAPEPRHAFECADCREKIDSLARPLGWFKTSVRQWSERQMAATFETAPVLLLTPESLEQPWYRGILTAIREAIDPPKLPPLQVTSKPIEVPSLWGFYGGHEKTAGASSVAIHAVVIALLFVVGTLKPVQKIVKGTGTLLDPVLKPYLPEKKDLASGGGGGGARSPLDASKGKLPKMAPRQFTPPRVDPVADPKLPMMPAVVSEVQPPNVDLPNYGDPVSRLGVPSNGTGLGGGIGSGVGGGVGVGRGPGVGPGSGGGFGGGAYRIGGGVSAPSVLSRVEPEYSEEARKAKWQGAVEISLVVDEHGMPQQMRVTHSLGLGLDEKALQAVAQWRFRPGLKDGKPVPVIAVILVNFRLL
jgi:protein TonB